VTIAVGRVCHTITYCIVTIAAPVLRSQDKLNVLDYTIMVIIAKVCLRSQRRMADNNSRR
jgi:hypothetical protein